jgi:hypothetical protein
MFGLACQLQEHGHAKLLPNLLNDPHMMEAGPFILIEELVNFLQFIGKGELAVDLWPVVNSNILQLVHEEDFLNLDAAQRVFEVAEDLRKELPKFVDVDVWAKEQDEVWGQAHRFLYQKP